MNVWRGCAEESSTLRVVIPAELLADVVGLWSCRWLIWSVHRSVIRVADIDSHWPIVFTVTSITGMIARYCATELHHTQTRAIEAVPGAASAWFAIAYAIGLLSTHISAIIGVLEMKHKDSVMVSLLAIYEGAGALNQILIIADHIGTYTIRWSLSFLYPLVWVIVLISFGALALAGIIGAYRTKCSAEIFGSGCVTRW